MPGHPGSGSAGPGAGSSPGIMPFPLSKMKRQWNGSPEPVPGLDPGIKPGNDEERDGVPLVAVLAERLIQAKRTWPREHEKQERKAEKNCSVSAVQDREETLRGVGHPIGHRHLAR